MVCGSIAGNGTFDAGACLQAVAALAGQRGFAVGTALVGVRGDGEHAGTRQDSPLAREGAHVRAAQRADALVVVAHL